MSSSSDYIDTWAELMQEETGTQIHRDLTSGKPYLVFHGGHNIASPDEFRFKVGSHWMKARGRFRASAPGETAIASDHEGSYAFGYTCYSGVRFLFDPETLEYDLPEDADRETLPLPVYLILRKVERIFRTYRYVDPVEIARKKFEESAGANRDRLRREVDEAERVMRQRASNLASRYELIREQRRRVALFSNIDVESCIKTVEDNEEAFEGVHFLARGSTSMKVKAKVNAFEIRNAKIGPLELTLDLESCHVMVKGVRDMEGNMAKKVRHHPHPHVDRAGNISLGEHYNLHELVDPSRDPMIVMINAIKALKTHYDPAKAFAKIEEFSA